MRILVSLRILALVVLCLAAVPARGVSFSGNVFEDLTGDGKWDPGEPGVAGVLVLTPHDGRPPIREQMPGGLFGGCGYNIVAFSFFFNDLLPGNYTVTVEELPDDIAPAAWEVGLGVAGGSYQRTEFPLYRKPGSPGLLHVIQGCLQGGCFNGMGGVDCPLQGEIIQLQDDTGSVIETTTTDFTSQYHFDRVPPGVYRVVALSRSRETSTGANPGPLGKRLDNSTIQVTVFPDVPIYTGIDFYKLVDTSHSETEPLLSEGDAVPGAVSLSDAIPIGGYTDVIRRVTVDGSLIVLDPAGTELRRIGPGRNELLLDSSTRDPEKVRLRRIQRAQTSGNGTSAVVAERADRRRVLYRLDSSGRLTYVDAITQPAERVELAVDNAGEIAYTGETSSGQPALLRSRPGTSSPDVLFRINDLQVGGVPISRVSDLTGNDNGDLAGLFYGPGLFPVAVIRFGHDRRISLVGAGARVATDRTRESAGTLSGLYNPRISPDGTVSFVGTGNELSTGKPFGNFFALPPGGGPAPQLYGTGWRPEYQYARADNGAVTVIPDTGGVAPTTVTYVNPAGRLRELKFGQAPLQSFPVGPPVLSPDGVLFFLGRLPDTDGQVQDISSALVRVEFDRNGKLLKVSRVAQRNQAIGSKQAQGPVSRWVLKAIPHLPVVSADYVAFAAVLQGDGFPEPTAGLFRVPLRQGLDRSSLLAREGDGLSSTSRALSIQDFYYTADGSLIIHAFAQRWVVGGQIILTVPPRRASLPPAGPSTQQARRLEPTKLLKKGDPLPPGSGRTLVQVLNRFVSVGPGSGRWVFAARYQQGTQTADGLFFLDGNVTDASKRVREVAVTGSTLPGQATSFAGFGDADLNRPSVSADGIVLFKARLRSVPTGPALPDQYGLFQWTGKEVTPLPVLTTDRSALDSWVAGPSGHAYFLAHDRTNPAAPVVHLCEFFGGTVRPLVTTGATQVTVDGRPVTVTDLSTVKLNGDGQIFCAGAAARADGSVFRALFWVNEKVENGVTVGEVRDLVHQEQQIPPKAGQPDPTTSNNIVATATPSVFASDFTLRQESACSKLYFEADVRKSSERDASSRGYFVADAQGNKNTLFLATLSYGSKNTGRAGKLPPDQECDVNRRSVSSADAEQGAGQFFAYASLDWDGYWAIYRERIAANPGPQSPPVATDRVVRERDTRVLVPGAVEPWLGDGDPDATPPFAISSSGDVVYLASENMDGTGWKQVLYRFSDLETAPPPTGTGNGPAAR